VPDTVPVLAIDNVIVVPTILVTEALGAIPVPDTNWPIKMPVAEPTVIDVAPEVPLIVVVKELPVP